MKWQSALSLLAFGLAITHPAASSAQSVATKRLYSETVAKAANFMRQRQAEDGSWAKANGPALTGLAVTALLRHGYTLNDPAVAKGLKYLETFVQPSGGVHAPDSPYRNYETCIAVLCFKEANKDGRYDKILKGADKFLKGEQWDESEGIDISDPAYGGAGYGKKRRPDLSNTNYLVEALRATGNSADEEALKKALLFVSRCQNLESEHNLTPFPAKNPDGGFYYTPAAGGESQAGTLNNGGLRSYASMTYAGLKSMIYAGLSKDDPRVKAAIEWLQKNYDLESNPGLGDAGLYYYYHTFAKALEAGGFDEFVDTAGNKHNWRDDLINELAQRQKPDGSWVNDNTRWLEGEAELVTSYALLALSHCRK
jgi:squalene-hopene/tetraprenyl-beta-curcumene cyclase